MAAPRRRMTPDERRRHLLTLGAEEFGRRPYDEVRIDEVAERAGVSRALMYHYFPDKRTFFAAVVRAEGDRLFAATDTSPAPGQSLFGQLRAGVLAYLRYDEDHPHGAWAAYSGPGRSDPLLREVEDADNDRQATRIMSRVTAALPEPPAGDVESALRITVYGWLAMTFELCRRRSLNPDVGTEFVADMCAHALLDAIGRVPGIPAALADSVATDRRR